ncbi:MAG: hypothetical protein R3330_09465 [Saprospiraceae bacterium]|nr:hypothetical protein [Saprospiraceae bacterium]
MKRTVFIKPALWWLVLVLLYGLMLWQIALVTAAGVLTGLLQAALLALLLYLVYVSHRLARRAVQLWAFFMLIFPSAFKLISKLLIASGSDQDLRMGDLTVQLAYLILGAVLLSVATWWMRTIEDDPTVSPSGQE